MYCIVIRGFSFFKENLKFFFCFFGNGLVFVCWFCCFWVDFDFVLIFIFVLWVMSRSLDIVEEEEKGCFIFWLFFLLILMDFFIVKKYGFCYFLCNIIKFFFCCVLDVMFYSIYSVRFVVVEGIYCFIIFSGLSYIWGFIFVVCLIFN